MNASARSISAAMVSNRAPASDVRTKSLFQSCTLSQIGHAGGGERADEVPSRPRVGVGADQRDGSGIREPRRRRPGVDRVAAVGRQAQRVVSDERGLRVLARDPRDLHHGQARAVRQHDRHLQQGADRRARMCRSGVVDEGSAQSPPCSRNAGRRATSASRSESGSTSAGRRPAERSRTPCVVRDDLPPPASPAAARRAGERVVEVACEGSRAAAAAPAALRPVRRRTSSHSVAKKLSHPFGPFVGDGPPVGVVTRSDRFCGDGNGYFPRMGTILWIMAVILITGILAIIRRQLIWGIVLIVVGLLVAARQRGVFHLTPDGRAADQPDAALVGGATIAALIASHRGVQVQPGVRERVVGVQGVGGGRGGRTTSSQRCRSSRVNRGRARGSAGMSPTAGTARRGRRRRSTPTAPLHPARRSQRPSR